MTAGTFRTEKDSMGEMQVPTEALWGAQTQRAVENFPISGLMLSRPMIAALGLIKRCAASVNESLGLLDGPRAKEIIAAAKEVEAGTLDAHFVVDVFQTGSGTSSNMNTNEVIATRARKANDSLSIHPNDHVNMSQSSNDVIPSAIHIALARELSGNLLPALEELAAALKKKSEEFADIVKTGRTHLQDATPITLGQEFSGYQSQIVHGIERIRRSLVTVFELPLGGTAVGTGLNTHPEFAKRTIAEISKNTGLAFREAENHFEAQAAKDALVEMSGQLKTVACSMAKIANDLRWLGSGPRCGFGELFLPEVQPGSSIMPAKVNPVIAESLLMVVAQVVGADATITMAAQLGSNFELNVMMPVMAHNILQATELLAASARNFSARCVQGIRPNTERIQELAEASIATCTALAPHIGYDKAAQIAKEAYKTKSTIRQVALKHAVLPEKELDRVLDLMHMTKPGL